MAHTNSIEELESRLKTLTSETDLIKQQIAAITFTPSNDDSDDDSPCNYHLQQLAHKLDKLMRKQNECILLLRNAGSLMSTDLYDGY